MPRNLTLFTGTLIVCLLFGASGAFAQASLAYCNLTLSPSSLIVDASGGTGTITITTDKFCNWTAYTSKPFLAITSAISGTGPGTITYSVAANNATGPLTGQIQVANLFTTYAVPVYLKGSQRPQTFNDVPLTYPAYDYINYAFLLGLTRGCATAQFCPDQNATRGEGAAFIVRSLLGENFTYSPVPYFTDVPASHPQFAYVQKLRELNITVGCGVNPLRYCPDLGLRRDEAAEFLTRARGIGFTYSQGAYFQDISPYSTLHFAAIQKVRELGVSQGCSANPPLFCPAQAITRAQLVTFVIRYLFTN